LNYAKRNGEIRYKDAIDLANNFPIDNKYIKTFKEYWNSGKLFEGIYGIKKVTIENETYYIYGENTDNLINKDKF